MGGDKPIGLVIGLVVVGVLVFLPALIVPISYVFWNVYAILIGTDFSSDEMVVGVFATLLVVTVPLCLLLMAALVSLIGKALAPKRSKSEI